MSVIITSYNEIKYLPQAIDSVLSQTFQDFEIIIGDDGSDDGSIELIKSYCEKYPGKIKYFVMDRPKDKKDVYVLLRQSNVYKTGFTKASGKYFVCLDGDDYFCDNNKFASAVNFLEEHKEYVAYMSGYKLVYQNGSERKSWMEYNYPKSMDWACSYIHLSSCIFRRRVFDEKYMLNMLCSDTAIMFPILCAGKVYYTDTITFAYRQRHGSIMNAYTANKLEFEIRHLMLFQDCLCSGHLEWSSCSKFYSTLKYVFDHRNEINYDKCRKYFVISEQYDNNIMGAIRDYDTDANSKKYIRGLLLKSKLANLFFKYAGKFYRLPFRIIRKCKKILSRN